jgi:Protein of unknown function (DUF2975)
MITENQSSIQRMCRWLRVISALFIFGVLAIYLLSWLLPELSGGTHVAVMRLHLAGVSSDAMAQLSTAQRLQLSAASLPYLVVLVWAFIRLDKLLQSFARNEFFTRQAIGHLRAFSGLLLIAKVIALAVMHIRVGMVTHLLSHANQPSQRVTLNLSNDDLAVILMCGLFFLLARMMEEGRRLAEENREFV